MGIIATVKVDHVSVHWAETPSPTVHFNAFGADGAPLPGLGGYVNLTVLGHKATWGHDGAAFVEALRVASLQLVRDFDEFSDENDEITLVLTQVAEYDRAGGHGVHVRFQRAGDPFEASLLFEKRPQWGGFSHNQKEMVTDAAVEADLDGRIDTIMAAATELVTKINKERTVEKKRGRKW